MFKLRKYGFTDKIIDDLVRLTRNNPEPECFLNDDRPIDQSSSVLAQGSKKPMRLYTTLAKHGIYNIHSATIDKDKYIFVAKAYDGVCEKIEIDKKQWLSYKNAMLEAIEKFIDIISPRLEKSRAEHDKLMNQLGEAKLDLPSGMLLTPELAEQLQGLIERVNNDMENDPSNEIMDSSVIDIVPTPVVD